MKIHRHRESTCGSLNAIVLHNIIGSGTIKRYAFFGESKALLENVSPVGMDLMFTMLGYCPVCQLISYYIQDVGTQLLLHSHISLHAFMCPSMKIMD